MQYWSYVEVEPNYTKLIINYYYNTITLYSRNIKIYKIIGHRAFNDANGDYNMVYKFVDQDGDRGTMKLLMRANGQSEIYIMFNNVKWCYIVEKKY